MQRLKPPLARLRRPAETFGALYDADPAQALEAVKLNHQLLSTSSGKVHLGFCDHRYRLSQFEF